MDTIRTGQFNTVANAGIYLTHFSVGIPPYNPMIVTLRGSANSPNILKTEDGYDGENMVSRDDIQFWRKGEQVYLSSNFSLYSDEMYQTSWSILRVDDIFEPVVASCRARTSNTGIGGIYFAPFPLTDTLLTVGNPTGACTNQFEVPIPGIYFISFSVGMQAFFLYSTIMVYLRVNSEIRSSVFIGYPLQYDYSIKDMSSNSVLLDLNEKDIVDLEYQAMFVDDHYSDEHYQTALTGFLYAPVHGNKIAWSVTQNNSIAYVGPITAFPFNVAWVNEGEAWDSGTNTATIPVSGIYWLKLSGTSIDNQFNMILTVNGQPLINVMEKVGNSGTSHVRSHSIAHRLNLGDQLRVSLPQGSTVYAQRYSAAFLGFLIYPDL